MKKLLGIVLIAGSLVACNNSSDTTSTTDSSTKTKDSINTMNTTSGDTSNKMKTDTVTGKMHADSTHRVDSTKK